MCDFGADSDRNETCSISPQNLPSAPQNGTCSISLWRLRPAPENEQVYRPIRADDPEITNLAKSIAEHGVMEPLVVTLDYYIISGHRRHTAAKLAGLESVPCRIEPITHDDPRFVPLLCECNRQRVKGFEEVLREAVVAVNPEQAYAEVRKLRKQKSGGVFGNVDLGEEQARAQISAAKRPFLDAVIRVLQENQEFLPLTIRAIHYRLLNDPPLRHAKKPASRYRNDRLSYQDLSSLITRGRDEGFISYDAIDDPTRQVVQWKTHPNLTPYLAQEMAEMFTGYWRDLLQSQPNHLELVVEKNTIANLVRPVAQEFTLPFTVGRGFASATVCEKMAHRYQASGKDQLILLILSDFDPSGEEIARSFAKVLRRDHGISHTVPIKVGITCDQVKELALPPNTDAKKSDARYAKFFEQHGAACYELEAIEPRMLQKILRAKIVDVLDREAFNREIDAEKADVANLRATRFQVCAILRDGGVNL